MDIREDDLTGSQTVRFLEAHLEDMRRITPPESVHALAVEELRSPDVTLWSAWHGDVLLGCGALKARGRNSAEIKAMRTDPAHRRQGVGSRILEHLIAEAQRRGYRHLYLEPGGAAEFATGRALYTRYGFEPRGPFGYYVADPNSVFMVKHL